ncbi:MAG: transporter permease [Glaciihabitans sp.]|nr:transporter permease [Glaciihabitans sp.]
MTVPLTTERSDALPADKSGGDGAVLPADPAGNVEHADERVHFTQRRWVKVVGGVLLPIVILATWQLISAAGIVPSYKLPSPRAVFDAASDLSQSGVLWMHIAISTQRVLLGFLAGAAIGLVVASIVGLSRVGSVVLSPTLSAIRAVPSLAWLPLLVLYVGINEDQKVALIAIGAFFPVFTTVSSALRHVDPQLVEAGRAYGYRGTALLRVVQLPAVVPSVISGLRLALAQSWLFMVAGELLGANFGLGYLLIDSQNNGRYDRLFVAIIVLAIFGKITDGVVGLLERYLLKRWG